MICPWCALYYVYRQFTGKKEKIKQMFEDVLLLSESSCIVHVYDEHMFDGGLK